MNTQAVSIPKLGWSFAEFEAASGLSRSTLYRMLAGGQLHTVKIRGRRIIPAWQAERLFDRNR